MIVRVSPTVRKSQALLAGIFGTTSSSTCPRTTIAWPSTMTGGGVHVRLFNLGRQAGQVEGARGWLLRRHEQRKDAKGHQLRCRWHAQQPFGCAGKDQNLPSCSIPCGRLLFCRLRRRCSSFQRKKQGRFGNLGSEFRVWGLHCEVGRSAFRGRAAKAVPAAGLANQRVPQDCLTFVNRSLLSSGHPMLRHLQGHRGTI